MMTTMPASKLARTTTHNQAQARKKSTLLCLPDDVLHRVILFVMWGRSRLSRDTPFRWCARSAVHRLRPLTELRLASRRLWRLVDDPRHSGTVCPGAALAHLRGEVARFDDAHTAKIMAHYHTCIAGYRDDCAEGMLCHRFADVPDSTLRVAALALSYCRTPVRFACVHEDLSDTLVEEERWF